MITAPTQTFVRNRNYLIRVRAISMNDQTLLQRQNNGEQSGIGYLAPRTYFIFHNVKLKLISGIKYTNADSTLLEGALWNSTFVIGASLK